MGTSNMDLKIIKKKYGENLMHLCRELFSTILDNHPGLLSKILLDNFYPSHDLYDDLVRMTYVLTFKNYIYNIYENIIALFIAWSIQLLILLGGKTISLRLGNKPLDALESLMGLLLTVVAVSMIIDNINQIYGIG